MRLRNVLVTMSSTAQRFKKGTSDVIDVLRELLARGDSDAVIQLVTKLMSTHDKQLREMFESARRRSTKNEGIDSKQLSMLVDELTKMAEQTAKDANDKLAAVAPVPPPAAKPQNEPRAPPPRRRPIPEHLPRVDNEIKVPAGLRACPGCGRGRDCIGHEMTSVIDIEPARVFVRVDRREKLACPACEGQVVMAPLGDKVVEGGAYGAALVADLIVGKYDDGLPLYRQHERFERLGLDMPTSSMGDQIAWGAELLQPIARALLDEVLGSDTMHMDGTAIPVLDRDEPGGIKVGQLWGYIGVDIRVQNEAALEQRRAVYLYTSTGMKVGQREGELGPEDVLEKRRGKGKPHVVADAAGIFDASFKKAGLIEVGCNMHGRRYFSKALDAKDARAALPLAAFKKLYDVEERLKGKRPDEKLALRDVESRPVYDELLAWAETYKKSEPPKSALGTAVRYLTNHLCRVGLSAGREGRSSRIALVI